MFFNKRSASSIPHVVLFFRNPLAEMEEEKKDHEQKMRKMEREMEQVFEMKVNEKMQKLKDSEADVSRISEQEVHLKLCC